MKSLQTCITQILIEQWKVGGVSHDGCCWPLSQGLVNLKQYCINVCITSPQLGLVLVDTLILLSIFDLVPQTQIYGLSRILSFSVSSVNLLSLRCGL